MGHTIVRKPRLTRRRRTRDALTILTTAIDWRAIGVACVTTFISGLLIGIGWGLFGVFLVATGGPYRLEAAVDALDEGAYIIPFCLGLLPELFGGIYLGRVVRYGVFRHCVMLGVISLGIDFAFSMAHGDLAFGSPEIDHLLAVIPAALLGGIIGDRL